MDIIGYTLVQKFYGEKMKGNSSTLVCTDCANLARITSMTIYKCELCGMQGFGDERKKICYECAEVKGVCRECGRIL